MQKPLRCLVLLAVHNGLRWLPEQLETILMQQGVDVHVLVSVDQSSDGSEAWITAQATLHPNISVLPHGYLFGGAAPNFFRLFREAPIDDFDFIALADQDDLWHINKLEHAIEQLQLQQAQGYSSNVLAFWPNGKVKLINKAQPQVRWDYLFEAAGPGCTYVVSHALAKAFQACLIANRTAVNKVGLHDWFLYAFARSHGYRWIIDAWPAMQYRQHGSNQVGTNTGWHAFWIRVKKVLNGWAITQTLLIADLVGVDQNPIIQDLASGSRFAYWRLLLAAQQCRRRIKDRIIFALMCLFILIWGPIRAKS